jgi:hypothetical protein
MARFGVLQPFLEAQIKLYQLAKQYRLAPQTQIIWQVTASDSTLR